jgi:hypothetical protein
MLHLPPDVGLIYIKDTARSDRLCSSDHQPIAQRRHTTMSDDKDKPTTASGSTDISSGTTDVSSGSQPFPPPTPAPPKPKPLGHEVDDALDQVENATNTGGVWGRPRR